MFPTKTYASASAYADDYNAEYARAAETVNRRELDEAARILLAAYKSESTVFTCGNGGSSSISNHFVCDHLKGVRTGTNVRPRVHSLVANIEVITAIANDIAFANVFAYQLESLATPGDTLVTVSSSGDSENIVQAISWAKDHGLNTIAFTGMSGGRSRDIADISLHVDAFNYGIVEDVHQSIMHVLAQFLRLSHLDESFSPNLRF